MPDFANITCAAWRVFCVEVAHKVYCVGYVLYVKKLVEIPAPARHTAKVRYYISIRHGVVSILCRVGASDATDEIIMRVTSSCQR